MAKLKTCKACKSKFMPTQFAQCVCDWKCSIEWDRMKKEKKARVDHAAAKKTFKLNDKGLQKKLAQVTFNKFIRARDSGLPCIACGRNHQGQIHASHYRSTGSQPQLRFNEDNCHAGCQPCNTHLSGNLIAYRINLVKKIGQERVDFLEREHPPKKYTVQDFISITEKYKNKTKEIML